MNLLKFDLAMLSKKEAEKYMLEMLLQNISRKKDEAVRKNNELIKNKERNESLKPKEEKEYPDFWGYVWIFIMIMGLTRLIIKNILILRLIVYAITIFIMHSNYIDKEKEAMDYQKKKQNYLNDKAKYDREIRIIRSEYNYCVKLSNEVKKAIKDVNESLNYWYAKANVHKRYRNLVAICTIYEYIDTGICSELEGSKGAYKFFEEQAMRGYIVSSIQQANRESLRKQQFLEEKLSKANKEISSMTEKLKSVDKNYSQLNQQVRKITGK